MLDLFDFDNATNELDQPISDSKPICKFGGDQNEILKEHFGFDSFRTGQQEIIDTIINDEECKGVLAVMATGAGKSLLFQLPAIMSDGLAIVVSPLISLMKDQVDAMMAKGLGACTINSTMTDKQVDEVMSNLGDCKLLYVSPERFKNKDFVTDIVKQRVSLFAVDECHCFTGNTLVSTPYGERRIDTLDIGDEVISYEDGKATIRRIDTTFVHRGSDVWKVRINGKDTYCDGGQEFFVNNTGFVTVDRLSCGDEIICDNNMRRVFHSEGHACEKGQTTKQILFPEVSADRIWEVKENTKHREDLSCVLGEVLHKAGISDDTLFNPVWSEIGGEKETILRENEEVQSHESPKGSTCCVGEGKGDRQVQGLPRGKRKGTNGGREVFSESRWIHDRADRKDRALQRREWLSNALQAGFVVAVSKDNNRSRRSFTQLPEDTGSRQTEGVVFKTARVESVSRVERGSNLPTGECLGENSVGVRLYDIEVEGSHNFFANGALVHNCVSQWGHDFRLSYGKLKEAIKRVSPARVVALTATATPEVQEDICKQLNMENAHKFVLGTYRSNLKISINQCSEDNKIRSVTNRLEKLIYKLLDDGVRNPTGIIYTATKKYAEVISGHLNSIGYRATFYHGGLAGKARTNIQDDWAKNGGIIVATCAFGMGIDRPDVRFVFHCGLTGSISEWWQMIGRSGRDGKEALCMTFFDQTPDYELQMFLLNMTNPTASDIERFWKWLVKFAHRQVEPGAKTVVINLTQKEMSSRSGCYNVGSIVSFLKKRNLISTLGRGKYRVTLKNPEFDFTALDALRKKKILTLNNVLDFFRADCCRMAYICKYYGDTTFVGRCEGCDWCRKNQNNLT